MLVYGCAALLCVLRLRAPVPRLLGLALAGIAGAWAAWMLPGVLAAGAFDGSEEERELGGLLLVAVASLGVARRGGGADAGGAGDAVRGSDRLTGGDAP